MSFVPTRGLWMIARRSLRQHALATTVTAFSVALGVGLVMAVFSVAEQSRRAFMGGEIGFDAVLGSPRGSKLEHVLNTVFHLQTSPGNLPWSMYEEIQRNPAVELAIPYAVGDNYQGFRIVATSEELFTEYELSEGRKLEMRPGGRAFDDTLREAVIGTVVAEQTGLRVGSKFQPTHGTGGGAGKVHEVDYTVVGILQPVQSPMDRVVWIPLEGFFRMDDHAFRTDRGLYRPKEGVAIPDEYKEISAVMIKLKDPAAGVFLNEQINNQGTRATFTWPIAQTLGEFFNQMGFIIGVLRIVAYLVMVVAAASILASLYNTMNERRREFAILRALGAGRTTVFGVIVLESATIALVGSLAGLVIYAAILAGAARIIRLETGVVLDVFAYHPVLWAAPLGMTLLGAFAGLLPAFKAYMTDVATHLTPST